MAFCFMTTFVLCRAEDRALSDMTYYLTFSKLGLDGVLPVDENPLSLSEESPYLRESQSLNGL